MIPVGSFLFLCRRIANRLQIPGRGFAVFVRRIFQCVAYLMHDAALVFRLWKSRLNHFPYPGEIICSDDQDTLHAAVLQSVKYRQPVFGAFRLADLDHQNIFLSFTADPRDHISCRFPDDSVILGGAVDRIDEED